MKNKLFPFAIACAIALTVCAVPAPNTATVTVNVVYDFVDNLDLGNFFLYYGLSSSNYTSKISIGTSTNFVLSGLNRNTMYFFNMTAASTNGVESDYTTEQPVKTWNKPGKATSFTPTATQ